MSAFLGLALLASCSSDDDGGAVDEEEAITQLILTFVNQTNATDTVVLRWIDTNLDEVVDDTEKTVTGEFDANEVYDATLELFNMDEDFLEEDITSSQAGIDAHFFVYGTNLNFTMARAANDFVRSDNNRLGANTTWTAGAASDGTISVALYHESPSVDDSTGFGSATGIDTDIDITFDTEID
ncbi:hypothetical protein WPG_3265 [Winogradskyella sp. PG-2]|nr:hypothetical protein WPG_3265 [Winogradskyella sp. PG-2]